MPLVGGTSGTRTGKIAVDAGRDPINGKRVRVVRGVHGGKRDAERSLNQLVTNVRSGRASASTATVANLLDRWPDNVGSTLSPRTLHGYRRVTEPRLVQALGGTKLSKLNAAHLGRGLGAVRPD